MNKHLLIALALVLAAGCSKKESKDSSGGGTSSDKPTEPAPAKLSFQKLGSLGLEAEVPEGANIDDTSKGAGFPSVTIYASPTTFISGAGDMSDLKPTLEETKARMVKEEKSLVPGKEEKTADGWIIEMSGKSITGDAIIAVSVRRTIGDKPFDCHSNVRGKDEVAKLTKLCQSIRAAK